MATNSDIYCAKIVFANQPVKDPASVGFPLEIALVTEGENLPPKDSVEVERMTEEIRAKLLSYRLENQAKVKLPKLEVGEFTAPMRALAVSLASCIVDDPELQAQIAPLLRSRDSQIQVDLAALLESVILEALLAACHGANSNPLSVTDLTENVNTILKGRAEKLQVSPETVGWKLKGFGFHTKPIARGNKGLHLTDELRAKIHALAAAFGVRTLRQGVIAGLCKWCDELYGPRTDLDS